MALGLDLAPPPLVRLVDIGDGGDPVVLHDIPALDGIAAALRECREPGDVTEITTRLRASIAYGLKTNRIAPGPVPFFRRALALCEARRTELAAQAAQASGGASVASWDLE